MTHDSLYRLFARNLSDEKVDLLFTFLAELTDLCFEAYEEQIVRIAQQANAITTVPDEPPDLDDSDLDDSDLDDSDLDDEIPF